MNSPKDGEGSLLVTQVHRYWCVTMGKGARKGITMRDINFKAIPYAALIMYRQSYPSQDGSIGSILAWYQGGPGFKSWQG